MSESGDRMDTTQDVTELARGRGVPGEEAARVSVRRPSGVRRDGGTSCSTSRTFPSITGTSARSATSPSRSTATRSRR